MPGTSARQTRTPRTDPAATSNAATYQPLRKPTIVLFGDSRTDDCDVSTDDFSDSTVTSTLNAYTTNMSWFDWGQAALVNGPVFDVLRNAGVGGNTTTQMAARLQADVLAYKPSHMTLWGGTNDGWTTTADVDATVTRMVSMIQQANAAGIYVFLISETVSSTKGNTFNQLVLYYNDRLRGYAAMNPNVEFWDFNSLFINPASTTGTPLTTMTRDGTHLSALGASTIGVNVVAKKLARFSTTLAVLPTSPIDSMGNNTNVRNVLSNPLMPFTTGGTAGGTGDTGQLPDSWSTSGAGAATGVFSTPARADGFGNDLKAVLTATASGSKFITMTVAPTRLVAGVPYVLEAAVSLSAVSAPVSVLAFFLQGFATAGTYQRGIGLNEQALTSADALAPFTGIFRSRKFIMPTGINTASLQLLTRFGAAGGSATVTLGRVSLKRVD